MRKPVYVICEQQRFRTDCASTRSDQQCFVHWFDSIIPIVANPEVSSLSLVSVAEKAGLKLRSMTHLPSYECFHCS